LIDRGLLLNVSDCPSMMCWIKWLICALTIRIIRHSCLCRRRVFWLSRVSMCIVDHHCRHGELSARQTNLARFLSYFVWPMISESPSLSLIRLIKPLCYRGWRENHRREYHGPPDWAKKFNVKTFAMTMIEDSSAFNETEQIVEKKVFLGGRLVPNLAFRNRRTVGLPWNRWSGNIRQIQES
jgi:hypothetical protein